MVSTKLLCAATSELCNSSSHSVELNVYNTGKLQSWPTFDQFWGLGFVWSRSNISRLVHLNSIITSTIYIGDLGMISLWMSIVQCSVVMYSVYHLTLVVTWVELQFMLVNIQIAAFIMITYCFSLTLGVQFMLVNIHCMWSIHTNVYHWH